MKVAVTIWEGRVSPVFDVCRQALLLTLEHGAIAARTQVSLDPPDPLHKIERLLQLGVETLICGAISEPLHGELGAHGVRVYGFVAGEIDAVVRAFIAGELPAPALSMPGCCGRQSRLKGGRGPGGRRGNGRGRQRRP